MILAPNLSFDWLTHGFGLRDSVYPDAMTTAKQVHSDFILDACGRKGEQIGEGDAILSGEPGVTVGIRTADCVPVLLVDSRTRAVAAVHAGWRGSALNISAAAVQKMLACFGSQPRDIHAAIGPAIGACCYEVSPDVANRFGAFRHTSAVKIDLPAINVSQLRAAGIEDIWISGDCTYCNREKFFSFRREGPAAGRMFSFVNRVL